MHTVNYDLLEIATKIERAATVAVDTEYHPVAETIHTVNYEQEKGQKLFERIQFRKKTQFIQRTQKIKCKFYN